MEIGFAVIDYPKNKWKSNRYRIIYRTESIDEFLNYIKESGIGGKNGI